MAAMGATPNPAPGKYVVRDQHGIVIDVFPSDLSAKAMELAASVPGYTLTFQP